MTFQLTYTPLASIDGIIDEVKKTFATGKTKSVEFRIQQLKCLGFMVQENEDAIVEALAKDLGRTRMESYLAEIWPMKEDIAAMIKNLPKWVLPQKAATDFIWSFASPEVYYEPKGAAFIIGAWNYPFALLIPPLVGAIAAGCTVVVKPSELAANSAALLGELIPKYLDQSCYKIVNGAVEETTAALDRPWDHVFFTGSTAVGRIIAKTAAKYMTPVTLELGGKSPVCVFDDADVDLTAKRLLFGKHMNAGQTCVAPDYILCSASIQPRLVAALKRALLQMFPDVEGDSLKSKEMPKIINDRNYLRLKKLVDDSKGKIEIGGSAGEDLKMGFTVVTGVDKNDSLMSEELFGPLLPFITVESKSEMVDHINSGGHPLALYVFTQNKENVKYIQDRTRSGQIVQNDCLLQFVVPGLPFGGVGPSGQGHYHGKASFTTFCYARSSLSIPKFYDYLTAGRFHPYTESNFKFLSNWIYPTFKDRPQHLPPAEKLAVKPSKNLL